MSGTRRVLLAAIAEAALAAACVAQCGSPQWFSANTYPGVDGPVRASILWDPDGPGPAPTALVVSGNFHIAGAATAERVAYWDGQAWHPLSMAAGLSGEVTALTVHNGELIAGGSYSSSGVARWTGSAWQALGATGPGGSYNYVWALASYNGDLYAAGNQVSKWDGAAWQLVAGSGINTGWALTVHNGALIVGGTIGTTGMVKAWNGATWSTLGPQLNGEPRALAEVGGALVAGGSFTTPSRVAQWDGQAWQPLGSGLVDPVYALGVWNGSLVASSGPGWPYNSPTTVGRWDGAVWQVLGAASDNAVRSFADFGGEHFAFGDFRAIGGIAASYSARWNGTAWSRFNPGIDSLIRAMISRNGDLIAGGWFSVAGDLEVHGVARWDGAIWQPLGTGLSPYGLASAFAEYNGDLIVGGAFMGAGGVSAPNVARWDGSAWHALGGGLTGPVVPGVVTVHALAAFNGWLVAGGTFTNSASVTMSFIARWNGISWLPIGTGMNGTVETLCVYNGWLYAGGAFSTADGVSAANIARWNGQSWQAVGTGIGGVVHALVVHGGQLVAGGSFATAGGLAAPSVARWNGVAWAPLTPVGNNGVRALASFGGDLIASSTLWALPTGLTPGIARWTGSSWAALGAGLDILTWQPIPFITDGAMSLAVHRGSLFAAGAILGSGSVGSPVLARWGPPLPYISITQPAGSGMVQVNDAWLIPGHTYYHLASADLCPGGAGTGPYGGLCSNDPAALLQQINLPLGTLPFHFAPTGTTASFGSYPLPPGFAFEAICADPTGGQICISEPIRYTVQ